MGECSLAGQFNNYQLAEIDAELRKAILTVNRGLKQFFSMYRPSCLIQAYGGPEKYWLVWAGPLANHPFNFNFIFVSDSLAAAVE